MKVISSKDNGSSHFVGKDDTFEESTSDAYTWGEWAFMINIVSFDGGKWGLETYKKHKKQN